MKKKSESEQSEKQFNKITYYFKVYQSFLKAIFFFSCQQQIIGLCILLLAFNEPMLIKFKQLLLKFRKLEVKDIQNLKKINKDVIFQQIQIKKYSKVNLKIPFTTENQYETVISLLFSFGVSEVRDNYGNSRVSQSSFLISHSGQTVTIKCLCNKNFIKYFYQKLISMQSIFIERNYQNWQETMKKLINQLNLSLSHQIHSIYVSSLADTKSYIDHCKFFLLFTNQIQLLNLPEQIQNVHNSYILKINQVILTNIAFDNLIAEFQITNPHIIFYSLFE
ncbi:transmembrane protein, putative (macronuclear) [Tetrahymena thermophila SB210]|uniref:Transmembrane protein, putative n=1 Tax=Tetrahymena thermophila (strain SB210) TaxID=312017 RepID=Q24EZ4_TETTS|nr:transmembrane protein, putative [Tetrahymena thermophila SB210]EAS06361.2 transmembrane protein, putative [Tetrahymena thermophila SB210]|eukprot:XP_001026606.2 transmembrane protein, putative [Tetrahymena thermophila SB210]